MKHLILAKRYVIAALANIPPEKHHDIYDQLGMLKKVLTEHPEVDKIITSEIVRKQEKIEFISELVEKLDNKDFWVQFFKVLILKNRCSLIKVCLDEFEVILCQYLKMKHINLVMAHTPDSETLATLTSELEKILNCKAIIQIEIDEQILGGFIASTEDLVIDASIRTSLFRFSRKREKWY